MTDEPAAPAAGQRVIVLALFFLSGISGLIYQVIWVRQFGNVFGNTLYSASLVTGVFMLGLGVGSWALGRVGDRRFRRDSAAPLKLYGVAELVIAGFGVALAFIVPRLAALSAALSSYRVGEHGWHELAWTSYLFRYAVAVLLLAPPAILMGGTLTLLIRFLVGHQLSSAGWRVGLLYGFNTAGAALGALLTDFALVPQLGVLSTQWVAVAFNVAAGAGALVLLRHVAPDAKETAKGVLVSAEEDDVSAAEPSAADLRHRRAVRLTATTLALSGFAAMGTEILWFRYLGQVLRPLRSVFSLLLAVILVGIWLGATLGGHLQRRFGRPALWLMLAQGLLAATVLLFLGGFDHQTALLTHLREMRPAYLTASSTAQSFMALDLNLRPILMVAAVPSLLMGLSFPLANAHVQRTATSVGGRAGTLYLFTTLGNVLGSVLVGFALLPTIGIRWTALVLAACAGLSTLPLWLSAIERDEWRHPGRLSHAFLASILLSSVSVFAFSQLPADRLLLPAIPRGDQGATRQLVFASEGVNETLAVIEVPGVERALYTNGHPMSSTSAVSQRYMRAFAHIPLLHSDAPTDVLVICFGVGNTLHAASLHPSVKHLEIADLSRHVLEHASLFQASNGGILSDPRVSVFVNDGRHHLLMQPAARYDLVTLEPPPIAFAGVAALYSREFYQLAKSRLKPGGFVTQWVPSYQVPRATVLAMVRAFVEVFPSSILLSGDDHELILMGVNGDQLQIDPDTVAARLRQRPKVQADLTRIYMGTPTDLFGSFAAAASTLRQATAGADVVTDDRPVLEYSQKANIQMADLPASIFDVAKIGDWCPGCRQKIPGLGDYLSVRDRIYNSRAFLAGGTMSFDDAASRAAIDASEYLRFLIEGEPFHLKKLGNAHLQRGDLPAALGAFRRSLYFRANDPDALFGVARVMASAGQEKESDAAIARVLALAPNHPGANAVMCLRAVNAGRKAEARRTCGITTRAGLGLSPDLKAKLASLLGEE